MSTRSAPTSIAPPARCLAIALWLALVPCAARADVTVGITPATQTVPPDSSFTITVDVTQAGSAFNGFDLVVSYDRTALTFLSQSQLQQEGCLMTGGCSAACGTTFYDAHAAADSVAVTDILLCDQVALTGPGTLVKLKFRAASTPETTTIQIRRVAFYNAGQYVTPVITSGAQVRIARSVGVGTPGRAAGLAIVAGPNPTHGPVSFAITSDRAVESVLEVRDVAGRLVRRLGTGGGVGLRRVTWDGRDAHGVPSPPGIYLASVIEPGRVARARLVLVH